jgi:hypothetical protein
VQLSVVERDGQLGGDEGDHVEPVGGEPAAVRPAQSRASIG